MLTASRGDALVVARGAAQDQRRSQRVQGSGMVAVSPLPARVSRRDLRVRRRVFHRHDEADEPEGGMPRGTRRDASVARSGLAPSRGGSGEEAEDAHRALWRRFSLEPDGLCVSRNTSSGRSPGPASVLRLTDEAVVTGARILAHASTKLSRRELAALADRRARRRRLLGLPVARGRTADEEDERQHEEKLLHRHAKYRTSANELLSGWQTVNIDRALGPSFRRNRRVWTTA